MIGLATSLDVCLIFLGCSPMVLILLFFLVFNWAAWFNAAFAEGVMLCVANAAQLKSSPVATRFRISKVFMSFSTVLYRGFLNCRLGKFALRSFFQKNKIFFSYTV